MSQFARTRGPSLGPEARPVAIPDDVEQFPVKARGVVELPSHIRWSGPRRRYDLSSRHDRALLYEQVLAEGTDDDIRFFIDIDNLVDLWDDLILPSHVRQAWTAWLSGRSDVAV
mgnify:CR=1 FL=1